MDKVIAFLLLILVVNALGNSYQTFQVATKLENAQTSIVNNLNKIARAL